MKIKDYLFIICSIYLICLTVIAGCGKKEEEESLTITLKTEKTEQKEKISSVQIEKKYDKSRGITAIVHQSQSEISEETEKKPEIKVKKRSASDIFTSGQKLYELGKYSQALEEFQTLSSEYPEDKYTPDALYMAGLIYLENLKLYPRSQNVFRLLMKKYPQYAKNDQVEFYIAKAFHLDNKYEEALIEYRKILENYPQSKISDNVLWEIGNIYYEEMQDYEEAKKIFRTIQDGYPASSHMDKVLFAIANICLEKSYSGYNEDEALGIFDNFFKQFPASNLRPQVEKKRQEIMLSREKIIKEEMERIKQEEEKKKKLEEERRRREERRRLEEEENRRKEARENEIKEENRKKEEELRKKLEEGSKIKESMDKETELSSEEIKAVIQNHKKAMENKDIKLYTKNWYSIPKNEEESAGKFFKRFKKININFSDIEMSVEGDSATAFITQDMQLVDNLENKEIKTSVKMKWGFIKDKGVWKINKTEVMK